MRTISVLLFKRPELLEAQVSAIINCQDLDKFDQLVFSIDGGSPESRKCSGLAEACAGLLTREGIINCQVVEHAENLGVAGHPLLVLNHAFGELGSDLNINLEDDALPKKDLLRAALWWESKNLGDSLIFCGSNHRDFGMGRQSKIPEDDPRLMAESFHLTSPFCWATTRDRWPTVRKWWDFKVLHPTGFDFSLSMGMRLEKKVSTHPVLSRCQNVGRFGGVHETEENFDRTQLGLTYQEGEYLGEYELAARVDRKDLEKLDDWMVTEMARIRSGYLASSVPFLSKVIDGLLKATDVSNLAPCLTFGNSHRINDEYLDIPKTSGFPNPWHIGTLDSSKYPVPHELIQGEFELLIFMFAMVLQLKPRLVVETGTNVGLMARALGAGCAANGFGRVVTSDTDPRMVEYARGVCEGLPVEVRCCPSLELPELREADLIFIDSSYESRTLERTMIKPGAVYVYHDSLAEEWIRPEMEHEQFKVHLDSPRGFSIVRKSYV